jgi:hypothetical protein
MSLPLVYIRIFTHTYYVCVYIYTYAYVYTHSYIICVCVCVYIHTHIYTYIIWLCIIIYVFHVISVSLGKACVAAYLLTVDNDMVKIKLLASLDASPCTPLPVDNTRPLYFMHNLLRLLASLLQVSGASASMPYTIHICSSNLHEIQ